MESPRRPILPSRRRWLEAEVSLWEKEGEVTSAQAAAILGRYESEGDLAGKRGRRMFLALVSLALVMFSVGLLLLIGYNWEEIPRAGKVAILFAGVVTAFAGSVVEYRRGRALAGELWAFGGVLIYGNAIWLLAQAFHIESHYPDGVLWWGIGALAAAHLLVSRAIGAQAIALVCVWMPMEAAQFGAPNYLFLPIAAALILLARRTASDALAGLTAAAIGLWLLLTTGGAWDAWPLAPALLLLLGCAYQAASLLGKPGSSTARSWDGIGLLAVLGSLIALTFEEVHRIGLSERLHTQWTAIFAAGGLLLAWTWGLFLREGTAEMIRRWPVLLASAIAFGSIVSARLYRPGWASTYEVVLALLFSALTVTVGLWLLRDGVKSDEAPRFFAGVIYLLVFVLVRWIDLIGDLLSSSALFLIAGVVLAAAAHFWRRRHAAAPEVRHG